MPRPKRHRRMGSPPVMSGFKPFGLPVRGRESIILQYDEYESLKLADYQGFTHEEAARVMNVSRPTFTRIYEKARQAIAKAFVEGKAIFIEGGNVHSQSFWYKCDDCYHITITDKEALVCEKCQSENIKQLTTTLKEPTIDPVSGNCICSSCNTIIEHHKGIPCREHKCPQCGKAMVREYPK